MSEIILNVYGNGIAYVDNNYPIDGDIVTLQANEDPGEELLDITARESHGYAVALATTNLQSFTYQGSWGDLTIDVYFSGSTPPSPRYWLWAILGSRRRSKCNG